MCSSWSIRKLVTDPMISKFYWSDATYLFENWGLIMSKFLHHHQNTLGFQ